MKNKVLVLAEQYHAALQDHISGGGEGALERAYELGREAISNDLGVLDITAVYQEALLKVLLRSLSGDDGARIARAAADFFMESLSPFEMAQRGYQDANATVLALNETLEQREKTAKEMRRMNTELRTARDAAVQGSRAKSAFLANMSHELRTPLNAIIGYAEMLQEDATDCGEDKTIPDLQKIQSAARHLLMLINEILDYARIEAGKVELRLEDFDVPSLVYDVTTMSEALACKNGNQLIVNLDPGIGIMHGDETKVRQVLFNLLSNACKFTETGIITLDVLPETVDGREMVFFRVSDTGIGMADQHLAKVFDEFYQAHERTVKDYGGTGLGLAISRKFCQVLGGDIQVDSKPGHGSRFTVMLPVAGPGESDPDK